MYCKELAYVVGEASWASPKSSGQAVGKGRQELKMESTAEIISSPPFLPVSPPPHPLLLLPTLLLQESLSFYLRAFLLIEAHFKDQG